MRQFFLELPDQQVPQPGQTVALDQEESHHLFTVLRGGKDLVLNLTDGRGNRYTARPEGKDRRHATVEILTVRQDPAEIAAPRLVLGCAVVKGKRFEWALEKAAEMGAHAIWPLITEHGVIEPGAGRRQRWLTILKSALKQCGRCWLPELVEPTTLRDALPALAAGVALYGAAPGEMVATLPWTAHLTAVPRPLPDSLALLVGPEGGWSPEELAALTAAGAQPIGLGPHVLRTETAAVAGLAALQALRQGWITAGEAHEDRC